MKVIVTGGCGYIGSHTIVDLMQHNFEVICIDNLMRSNEYTLEGIEKITGKKPIFYKVDICNKTHLMEVFKLHKDAIGIIHFAALKSVGESVEKPLLYFENNLTSLINVLLAAKIFKIPNFVFSSSCSVYGNVEKLPVDENTPFSEAECAYARSKQMGEQIIKDFARVNTTKNVLLRYFNPVGAHESANIGEIPIEIPNNLVPYITQTAIGLREELTVFGNDYDTKDGSCIRDYIHVCDIANAHTKALQYLIDNKNQTNYEIFNLGTGTGISVLEAINAFEKTTNVKLNYKIGNRRNGDVVAVYADNTKAKNLLGWQCLYDINDMMKTAWQWQLKMKELGLVLC